MNEVIIVKVVNGYEITRRANERQHYTVVLAEGQNWKKYVTFRTVKAAAEYCASL